MKVVLFLLISSLCANIAISQSQAGAFASATIVSPVGVELASRSNVTTGSIELSKTSFNKLTPSKNIRFKDTIAGIASIKVIGSVNLYNVSIQTSSIILRNAMNDSIIATFYSLKSQPGTSAHQAESTEIISTVINATGATTKGLYTPTVPFEITINYN